MHSQVKISEVISGRFEAGIILGINSLYKLYQIIILVPDSYITACLADMTTS